MEASNQSPLIILSTTFGATMTVMRRPATNVVVLRWPRRSPCALARPWDTPAEDHARGAPSLIDEDQALRI
jgi:hypothetical protein